MPIIGGGIIGGGGGAGTTDNTTEERIPYKSALATFENSPLYYDVSENKVVCDVTFEVPSGTLAIGETTNISAGSTLIVSDEVNEKNTYIVASEWNSLGSQSPVFPDFDAQATIPLQPDFSTTITANPLNFSITGTVVLPKKRQVNVFKIKTGAIMTNARARLVDNITGVTVRYIPSKAAWDSNTGLTLVAGDNAFDFISTDPDSPGVYNLGVNPFIIENGQQIDIEIRADAVSILGNVSLIPYQEIDAQDYLETSVIAVPGGNDRTIQFNDAGSFGGDDNFTYNLTSDRPIITLQSESTTGGGRIRFNNSSSIQRFSIDYAEASDSIAILSNSNGDANIGFDSNLDFQVLGDYNFILRNDEATFTINDFASNYAFTFANGLVNTVPLLILSKPSPGGTSQIFTSIVGPNGVITGNGGDLCIVDAGTSSDFYLKRSDGGNTGWVDFLHADSGVKGPASSTDNAIATWDGTDGDALNNSNAFVTSTVNSTFLAVNTITASGQSVIELRNNASVNRFTINYNQLAGTVNIASATATDILFTSGGEFELRSNDIMTVQALGDYAVTINNNQATLTVNDSAANYRFDFTNTLASTLPLLQFSKTGTGGGISNWFFSNTTPEGAITANGGDLCIQDSGLTSNIYLKIQDATNTNWQSLLGDVIGPASSTDSALALFDGTTGKLLKSSSLITVNETTETELRLKSPSAILGSNIVFESFDSSKITLFEYDEIGIETSIVLTGTAHSFELISNDTVELRTVTDDSLTFRNDNSSYIIEGSSQSYLHKITNNQPNTNSLIRFSQTGTSGGTSDWHFSTVAPEGVITGVGGDICIRSSAGTSDIYLKRVDGGNTGWVDLLHGSSGVQGPASSTDNAIATWNGTTGLALNNTNASIVSGANDTELFLDNGSVSGQSGIRIRDNLDITRYALTYNQILGDVFVTTNSGIGYLATIDGPLHLDSNNTARLSSTANSNVDIGNSGATLRVGVSGVGNRLSFSNVTADTFDMVRLQKTGANGGTSELFLTSRTPIGNITGFGGDLAIRDSGVNSNVYIKRVDGGTTGWNVSITNQTESSTLNAIPSFDVTTGNSLAAINTATLQADATTTFMQLRPVTSAGNAEINYRNVAGSLKTQLYYDEDVDSFNIESNTSVLNFGNFGGPLRFTSISADSDLYIRTATPIGVVTGNPGDLSTVVSGTSSAVYVHEGAAANNTDWKKVLTLGDVALASILRLNADGNSVNRTLSATPTQIIDFTTNGDDFGILTSDQANNEIVIDSVVDSINGDLYEIGVTISVQCSNTNREFIIEIYSNNGVSDTATDVRTHSFFDSANELYTKSVRGYTRGPSSITGTGAFKVFFSSPDAGTVQFREVIFTAKRLL